MGATIVEHGSPTGGRRRNAEAEETHGGFGEDGSGHADGRLHHDRLNNIRQDVPDNDAQVAGPQSAGGLDEFAFARGEDLSSNEARIADPSTERERENHIDNAGPTEGDKSDGQQNAGE